MTIRGLLTRTIWFVGWLIYLTFGWVIMISAGAKLVLGEYLDSDTAMWTTAAILPIACFISWKASRERQG
ncbi:MAG: hypothetical protein ING66_07490 [Rhodocyclaceae bacterium]|nr:hypothetical protein [Rhodocyclaceae bacterium]MCA3035523.1 hypothetical protein [Rhodocyclaceae bacterium]MCA3043419.1 hypothetical protein [Rhodocyclaceae bacterium]MCA3061706.1 hypothetical protein [Rhodocyclaceae bacterium]MCA3081956.1 hypothetical protein [Rhodocyclaceae bacterium]